MGDRITLKHESALKRDLAQQKYSKHRKTTEAIGSKSEEKRYFELLIASTG